MAGFLTYVFVNGPAWLRRFVWLCLIGFVLYGCFTAFNNFRYATERQVPAHVHHVHTKPARYVRR